MLLATEKSLEISVSYKKKRHLVIFINGIYNVLKKLHGILKYLGPAFIVSVAYIDPGNFATNISGGSLFNYNLLWVILWSNIMAIFLQIMSAKLGIATENNLTQMCRKVFSRKINWCFWIVAELAAMATSLAEILGGALGFYLLFDIPLPVAGILTASITFLITYLQKYGQRVIEVIITAFVAIISVSYAIEMLLSKPNFRLVTIHTLIPSMPNSKAVLIAVGMLGATVMPHVIYLHSELVQCRNKGMMAHEKKKHLKMEKIDVLIAMNIAFIVNAAMVVVSAAVFYKQGILVDSIEMAHKSLQPLLGTLSSAAFGVALLASGFSSSTVAAMAGETVMEGFVNVRIPHNIKKIITMLPGIIIILIGVNPMMALVLSQVCLSFALPVAIIPMLIITSKVKFMGEFVNKGITKIIGCVITGIIIIMNAVLLYLIFVGKV